MQTFDPKAEIMEVDEDTVRVEMDMLFKKDDWEELQRLLVILTQGRNLFRKEQIEFRKVESYIKLE